MRTIKLLSLGILLLSGSCNKSDKTSSPLTDNGWRLKAAYTQPVLNNSPIDPTQQDFDADFLTIHFSKGDSFLATGGGGIVGRGTYQLKGAYLFAAPTAVSGIWLDNCSMVIDAGQTLTLSKTVYTSTDSSDYTQLREVFVKAQ